MFFYKIDNDKNVRYTTYMESINKTLKYYELLMTHDDLNNIKEYSLQEGYKFVFFNSDKDIEEWIRIHIESKEFCSLIEAKKIFHDYYDEMGDKIYSQCIFIEDRNGKKIATATLSLTCEDGYPCVLDWFAISKDYQGKGLSKPLLYRILTLAKEQGFNKILLHTQTHTFVAVKIYLDFGFKPLFTEDSKEGWQIVNNILNHEKLANIGNIDEKKMYDPLVLSIKDKLDSMHTDYSYSVWYKDGRNDVYVYEKGKFYSYKFIKSQKGIELIKVG